MDLEQRLRASLVAPDPGAAFTARVMARVARAPARRRTGLLLLGSVMAVAAAAAAVLTWRMSDPAPSMPVAAEQPDVPAPAPAPARSPAPAAEDVSVVVTQDRWPQTASEAQVFPVAPAHAAPTATPDRRSVRILPLQPAMRDLAEQAPIRALHAALIEELRKIPDLEVQVEREDPQQGGDSDADYVVRLASAADAPSGVVTVIGGSQGRAIAAAGVPRPLRTEVIVQPRVSAAQHFPLVVSAAGAMPAHCSGPEGILLAECRTPAELAEDLVMTLRLQMFPPDADFFQRVVEQLHGISLGECNACTAFSAGEQKVLQTLQQLASGGGSRLDADTVHAIARYAASQSPRMRANVWSTLRWARVSHPALVKPLTETLDQDADQQVRLIVLAHLEADYSADPAVRRALDATSRDDPDGSVRAAAQRALHGQTQWRQEIMSALPDTSLSYEARLAPLIASGLAVSPAQQEQRRLALREPQILLLLTDLIREHQKQSAHEQVTRSVLEQLVNVDDPAVFDLFTDLIRSGRLAGEITVHPNHNQIDMSGPVSAWTFRHSGDPRVLQLLSEVDPGLHRLVEGRGAPTDLGSTPSVEAAGIPSGLIERMRQVSQPQMPDR